METPRVITEIFWWVFLGVTGHPPFIFATEAARMGVFAHGSFLYLNKKQNRGQLQPAALGSLGKLAHGSEIINL